MENEKNMKKEVKCSYAQDDDVSVSNASLIEAEEEKEEN